MSDVLSDSPLNEDIQAMLVKCYSEVQSHQRIVASISGGSDSDVMLDLLVRCGGKSKTTFVFFNTGLEYAATRQHIHFLNEKYDVTIQVVPPVKPIPRCVKEYGVPFWSKHVSEMIERLQRHGFAFEDEPFDVLLEKYPKCRSALRWWCNGFTRSDKPGQFDIGYVRGLKEFLIAYPPTFRISAKCCHYAKKVPAHRFLSAVDSDLNCVGIRRSKGGVRAARYSSCFSKCNSGPDQYRPLFWISDDCKRLYDEHYGVIHSDCYEKWGMKRTGCSGCPFGRNYELELELARCYEPLFYQAMLSVFGQSYEYRRKFEAFRKDLILE